MDLIHISDGIQSVQRLDSDTSAADIKSSRRFVPKGESVIRHTDELFNTTRSHLDILNDLIAPTGNIGVDPNDFDGMARSTLSTLYEFAQSTPDDADPSLRTTLHDALTVLHSLQADRQLLQDNISALERV